VERFDNSDGYVSHIGNRYGGQIMGINDAIALIKGENK